MTITFRTPYRVGRQPGRRLVLPALDLGPPPEFRVALPVPADHGRTDTAAVARFAETDHFGDPPDWADAEAFGPTSVIERSFKLLASNWLRLSLLHLIYVPLTVLIGGAPVMTVIAFGVSAGFEEVAEHPLEALSLSALVLDEILLQLLHTAVIGRYVEVFLREGRRNMFGAIGRGFRVGGSLVAAVALLLLAAAVSVPLVIPAILLLAWLMPIIPVIVNERRWPMSAALRSWRLGHGHRWPLLVLWLLMLLMTVFSLALAAAVYTLFSAASDTLQIRELYVIGAALAVIVGFAIQTLLATIIAMAYSDLRTLYDADRSAQ